MPDTGPNIVAAGMTRIPGQCHGQGCIDQFATASRFIADGIGQSRSSQLQDLAGLPSASQPKRDDASEWAWGRREADAVDTRLASAVACWSAPIWRKMSSRRS